MDNDRRTAGLESTESEIATFLSILREPRDDNLPASSDSFSILPYFVGHLLYPPHLPRFTERVSRTSKKELLSKLDELTKLYESSYSDRSLTYEEAADVSDKLESVGNLVAKYIQGFKRVWSYLERGYHNL